jgi:hypothetical protein
VPRPTPAVRAAAVAEEKKQLRKITPTSTAAAYLESRGISKRTLQDPRFDNVYTDTRGNACFPHNDGNIFSGCEKKNQNFTGFSPGGNKGLYQSRMPAECDKIIFCESGIDAMSHAELHPDNKAAYVSVAGQMSIEQEKQIQDLIERNEEKTFVAGFDNDKSGRAFADDLQKMCSEKSVAFETDLPPVPDRDWNEQLQETPEPEPDPDPEPEPYRGPELSM